GLLVVALHPEGDQGDVDVALGEGLLDDLVVGFRLARVERHGHHRASGLAQPLSGRLQPLRRAGGQDDPHRTVAGVLLGDGQRDVGRAAEHQQRLGVSNGVDHSSSLRLMSETKMPSGSTVWRIFRNSFARGYILWKVSAVVRESFAVYSRPPNDRTSSSSSLQNRPSPSTIGKSKHTSQPGCG